MFFFLTGKSQQVQALVFESFEKYLAKTDIQLHFDEIADVPVTRVLKQQLQMIHKESGIHVYLLADDATVAETPKIIRDFIAVKPICKTDFLHNCWKQIDWYFDLFSIRSQFDWMHIGLAKCIKQHSRTDWNSRIQV